MKDLMGAFREKSGKSKKKIREAEYDVMYSSGFLSIDY